MLSDEWNDKEPVFDEWTGKFVFDEIEREEVVEKFTTKIAWTYIYTWESTKRTVINRGGTRSSKTYSIVQIIVEWLFSGEIRKGQFIDKGVCTIVRKNNTTIKKTVLKDFEEVLYARPDSDKVKRNMTDRTYEFRGRTVQFIGADEEQKVRGLKSNILYCNEANELLYKKQFFQLNIRTTDLVFIDLNPSDPDVWVNTELEQKADEVEGGVDVIVSTYKDNPFLSDYQISKIEELERTDKQLWQVYGLGNYGKIEGLVYNWHEVDSIPRYADFIGYGLDFGFTNDPTAFVEVFYYDGGIYARDLIYDTGLYNKDIAALWDEMGIDKDAPIYADSSDPKAISELCSFGYNVHGVEKPAGSVLFGISIMQSNKLYYTSDSTGIAKEQGKYKWLEHRQTGKLTNNPIDDFNHALDAIRYVAYTQLRGTLNPAIRNHWNDIEIS